MKITEPSGRRRARAGGAPRRLASSLAAGAIVAGVIVAWDDLHNRAALVAAAAAPEPKGVHETVGSILASGGVGMFLIVSAVVFAIATVVARIRRGARMGQAAVPMYSQPAPRRRGRASARW